MKKFFRKIALFLIIFTLLNTIVFFGIQKESIGLSIENQKIAFVENSEVSPKMLISGGSNVGYSLDCELLSEKLNIEAYNVSFSISHGYELILNYIASNLNKGDIFLYIPEYDHYYIQNENMMSNSLGASIYNKLSLFQHLSFAQKVDFITKIPKFNILLGYKNVKHILSGKATSKSLINSKGDYIYHLDQPQTWKKTEKTRYEKYKYDGKLSEHFKTQIIQAKKLIESKGALFYISFPAIAASQYDKRFKEDIEKFYKNTNINIVGSQGNYIFPDNLIYDHPYHTMRKGRTKRTRILAKDMQEALTKK